MQEEIFKDIPNYEGIYQVSNIGRVKSLSRKLRNGENSFRTVDEKISIGSIDNVGYFSISLFKDCKEKKYRVHQLMAMSFLNHKPNGFKGLIVDHINNIKTYNSLENLQLVTNRENSSKDTKGKSKYVGVCFSKKIKKWQSSIVINGKNKWLGYFTNEIEASNAYQEALNNLQQI